MTDPVTNGKLALSEPPNGSYVNIWDQPLQSNWITLDAAVSGTTTVTLSNLNVVLVRPTYPTDPNPASATNSVQNLRLLLTGTLSANVAVSIPSGIPGMWLIDNQTTGSAFTVTVNTTAGGSIGVTPLRGYLSYIFSDGTNVRYADSGPIQEAITAIQTIPPGAMMQFAGLVAPSGWLLCDGTAVSRTTYAALFTAIGTLWGAGNGTTTFNIPNFVDVFPRGAGSSPVGTYEADAFGSHTHVAAVTDPGHNHTTALLASANSIGNGVSVTGVTGSAYGTTNGALTTTNTTGISVTNAASGGTETRPKNRRVLFIVKT
jgi:microcystin-dependent protein